LSASMTAGAHRNVHLNVDRNVRRTFISVSFLRAAVSFIGSE